jgi:hypothetical protein
MNPNRRRWLLSAFFALLAQGVSSAANEAPPVRILFLGNSLTYYNILPEVTRDVLARSGVLSPIIDSYAQPGYYLGDHIKDVSATARLKRGAPDGNPWDVLVLQEQSMLHAELCLNAMYTLQAVGPVREFLERAREANPDCLVVLMQVWSRHQRRWDAKDEHAVITGSSAAEATVNIHRGTVTTLKEAKKHEGAVRILISPVGDFWQLAREKYPKMPLYEEDDHHPARLGTSLSALVLAGTIGGRQAIEKTTCPEGVPEADFQKLQKLVLDHPEVFKQAGE